MIYSLILSLLACLLFQSCSTTPALNLRIKPNTSGIAVSEINYIEDHDAIRQEYQKNYTRKSNILVASLKRTQAPKSPDKKKRRYFIPPSGNLEIVHLKRYLKKDTYGYNTKTFKNWEVILAESGAIKRPISKNEIPWFNAAAMFHGKLRRKDFSWGRAVMFLTHYVQGKHGGPVNNDMLTLVVQGISHDGKYFISAKFAIRHPKLPDSSWDKQTKGKAIFSLDDEYNAAEKWLDRQADNSFKPTFQQYEQFLNAIDLKPNKNQ